MSSDEEGCVSSFEVHVDGPGKSIDVFGGSLLLLGCSQRRGKFMCNVSPPPKKKILHHEKSLLKGNLETCFDVPRRNRETQRRVNNTSNVIQDVTGGTDQTSGGCSLC